MGSDICLKGNEDMVFDLKKHQLTTQLEEIPKYQCLQTITEHKEDVTCLIVLKDSRLASGSVDSTIIIWQYTNESSLIKQSMLKGHTNSVISLSEIQNKMLCSSSVDKTLRIWKLSSMKCFRVLTGHTDSVLVSLQLPKNKYIISASDDKTIRVWALNKEKEYSVVKILEGHNKPISALIAIEADDKIISGSDDGTVRIWSIEQMVCVEIIDDFNNSEVYCLGYDRRHLIVACGDGNVYFYMYSSLTKMKSIMFSMFGVIDFFVYQREGIMGFACADGKSRIWKIGTKDKITLKGHTGVVKAIKRLKNGRVVTCSQDKTIRIWEYNPDYLNRHEKNKKVKKGKKVYKEKKGK